MTQATLNPALRKFWETPGKRYKVLYGGRASSKSWDAAGYLANIAAHYPLRIVCCRQFLNRTGDSIYALLKGQIQRFELSDKFDVQSKLISSKAKAEISFYGLWRNIEEVKSLEDVSIVLIEEAGKLTEEQFTTLDNTFRKPGFFFIIIFNPGSRLDYAYQRFVVNPLPFSIVRKINFDENPFLDEEYIERVIDTARADEAVFNHVFLGEPLADSENAIIKSEWIRAAIDGHIKLGIIPTGERRLGFDVADAGADACCTVLSHGSLVYGLDLWKGKENELLDSAKRAYNSACVDSSRIIYDSIGVGAGVGAKIKEINELRSTKIEATKYIAGGAVRWPDAQYAKSGIKNKDFFANVKAQDWWGLADRFKNTYNAMKLGEAVADDELIFIDSTIPHLEALIDELSTPIKSYDKAGRVKVESKEDMAKRGVPSPNMADAFLMAVLPDHSRKRIETIVIPKTANYFGESSWMG
jgi:phage terminase large subunit